MFKPNLIATLTATLAMLGASVVIAQEIMPAPEIDSFVAQKTRAEVVAETQDAARRGLIPRNEAESQWLAEKSFVSRMSRAQVSAEAAEAVRLGLVVSGEAGTPQATPRQLEQIRAAGPRALESGRLLASN